MNYEFVFGTRKWIALRAKRQKIKRNKSTNKRRTEANSTKLALETIVQRIKTGILCCFNLFRIFSYAFWKNFDSNWMNLVVDLAMMNLECFACFFICQCEPVIGYC